MKLVASRRRRFGYRRIHVMLDRHGKTLIEAIDRALAALQEQGQA
jgi:hypothetical protein